MLGIKLNHDSNSDPKAQHDRIAGSTLSLIQCIGDDNNLNKAFQTMHN